MDFKKQVEDIIKASEYKAFLESVDMIAQGFAVFYLTLKSKGLEKEEALHLTTSYIIEVVTVTNHNTNNKADE